MRIIIIITFAVNSIIGQDSLRIELANKLWNDEIHFFKSANEIANFQECIEITNNQKVSTNCWSNFYRYRQCIQQPSGEKIFNESFDDVRFDTIDSSTYILKFIDSDINKVYRTITVKSKEKNSSTQANKPPKEIVDQKFLDEKLMIDKVIFQDSIFQYLDSCHQIFSLKLKSDMTFEQSYSSNKNCSCEISPDEYLKIKQFGPGKFSNSNHSLFGTKGEWKTINNSIILKFENGLFETYQFQISENKLVLEKYYTKIILVKSDS